MYGNSDIFIYKDIKYIKKYNLRNKYIILNSITKFIIILVFILLHKNKILDIKTPINKIIKNYPYKITILDILQHKSGLNGSDLWWDFNKNDFADFFYKWTDSSDIYKFVVQNLIQNKKKEFDYNNYAYYILGEVLKIKLNKDIQKIVKNYFCKDIRIQWVKNKGLPHMAYGLNIYYKDILKFINNLMSVYSIVKNDFLKYFGWRKDLIIKKMIGHSGSGGQYIYFNDKECLIRLVYGNPDEVNKGIDIYELIK